MNIHIKVHVCFMAGDKMIGLDLNSLLLSFF